MYLSKLKTRATKMTDDDLKGATLIESDYHQLLFLSESGVMFLREEETSLSWEVDDCEQPLPFISTVIYEVII